MQLFLERSSDRRFPEDFAGDVLVWDIDKTYLDTHFSSWRGLLRIPLEFAIDKTALPGTVPLLRALRRGGGEAHALVPLFFVSGSPLQMRRVLERKMLLDGVDFDGITFKDQFGLLRAGRPREIKEQIGYKLTALLLYRQDVTAGARWLLFGDDVEADAQSFTLFGEVLAGLRGEALRERLQLLGVSRPRIEDVLALAAPLAIVPDPVQRVFIHLERGADPASFTDPRVVPTRSFLQTALALGALQKIRPEAISAVADDLRRRMVPEAQLEAHLQDAEARLKIPQELLRLARR
jgi:hypothetical protein